MSTLSISLVSFNSYSTLWVFCMRLLAPFSLSLSLSLSLSVLTAIFLASYQNFSIPDLIGATGDESGGDSWSYKTRKAPIKSSPPTNQHPVFYRPDALPVAQPTVSDHGAAGDV